VVKSGVVPYHDELLLVYWKRKSKRGQHPHNKTQPAKTQGVVFSFFLAVDFCFFPFSRFFLFLFAARRQLTASRRERHSREEEDTHTTTVSQQKRKECRGVAVLQKWCRNK
jgi:hypothetical protein